MVYREIKRVRTATPSVSANLGKFKWMIKNAENILTFFLHTLYNLHWYWRLQVRSERDVKALTTTEGKECISVPVTQESFRFEREWIFPVLGCNQAPGRYCVSLHWANILRL
jgi:hypothetical protein